jgi:hypothetical protein
MKLNTTIEDSQQEVLDYINYMIDMAQDGISKLQEVGADPENEVLKSLYKVLDLLQQGYKDLQRYYAMQLVYGKERLEQVKQEIEGKIEQLQQLDPSDPTNSRLMEGHRIALEFLDQQIRKYQDHADQTPA